MDPKTLPLICIVNIFHWIKMVTHVQTNFDLYFLMYERKKPSFSMTFNLVRAKQKNPARARF